MYVINFIFSRVSKRKCNLGEKNNFDLSFLNIPAFNLAFIVLITKKNLLYTFCFDCSVFFSLAF